MENLDAATQLYLIRKIIEAEFPEKMEQFGDNVAMAVAWSFDKFTNELEGSRIDAWNTIWDKLKEIDPNIGYYGNTGLEGAIRVIENLQKQSEPKLENGIVSCPIFITPDGEKFYEYEKALEYTKTFDEVKQVVLDSITFSEIDNYDLNSIVKNIIAWGNK